MPCFLVGPILVIFRGLSLLPYLLALEMVVWLSYVYAGDAVMWDPNTEGLWPFWCVAGLNMARWVSGEQGAKFASLLVLNCGVRVYVWPSSSCFWDFLNSGPGLCCLWLEVGMTLSPEHHISLQKQRDLTSINAFIYTCIVLCWCHCSVPFFLYFIFSHAFHESQNTWRESMTL